MRKLTRWPASYRARFSVHAHHPLTVPCITRDMHAQGALLHLRDGVPDGVRVGARGEVTIDLADRTQLRYAVDVRHIGVRSLGVRFLDAECAPLGPAARAFGTAQT